MRAEEDHQDPESGQTTSSLSEKFSDGKDKTVDTVTKTTSILLVNIR